MSREEVRKEEEAASALFRKKTDGERKEKKKRLRKKPKAEGLDLDALAAMTAAEGGNDLGSKASREARLGEREAAATDLANAKKERFDRALAKADARSRAMEHEGTMPTSTPMEVEGGDNNGGMEEEEEEAEVDVELYAALSRARRLTAKKEQQEQQPTTSPRSAWRRRLRKRTRRARRWRPRVIMVWRRASNSPRRANSARRSARRMRWTTRRTCRRSNLGRA